MKIYAECEYCGKKFEKKFSDEYMYKCMLHELKETLISLTNRIDSINK